MSYLLKFDCILLILCLVSSFTFAFNNSGFPELSLGESSGFTLHFILTFSAKKCILYINTMLSFEGDKNEKIQKTHEIERTIAKEICKCGRAFPCRIHGFVVY